MLPVIFHPVDVNCVKFCQRAKAEQNIEAVKEFNEQGRESNEHAQAFKKVLDLAEKRFNALKKVEERHANAYKQVLEKL